MYLKSLYANNIANSIDDVKLLWRLACILMSKQRSPVIIQKADYREYAVPHDFSTLYSQWSKDINDSSDNRLKALELYCGSVSQVINNYLRGIYKKCAYQDVLQTMQSLLQSSPCLPNNTILYRAIPHYVLEHMISAMKNCGIFQEKGFLSTSLNLNGIAHIQPDLMGEIRFVLKIYVPKGVHAVYVDDIKASSMGRGELEVILPRDSIIQISRIPYKDKRFGYWVFESVLEYSKKRI